MEKTDRQEFKDIIRELVVESVYEQTVMKDAEVSKLHREIKNEITLLNESMTSVKRTVDGHDLVVQEAIELWKTASWIKRFVALCLYIIVTLASAVAAFLYLKGQLFIHFYSLKS